MKGRNTTHLERWREMHAERAARRERIRYGETERERENRELSFCSNWQVEEYAA